MIGFNHIFFSFLAFPVFVSAHGYVGSVTIDGKNYQGSVPGGSTNPSAIRQVSTIDPVKGSSNPSLNCGMNAAMASNSASANPGSQVLVHWVGGATGSSNWPHNVGPIMHYMTKCSDSCSSYDSTSAEWFKISELGLQTSSTWFQAGIVAGEPANITIPSNIAPGNYLLRSELISLQLAVSVGGAEFYPACIQLSIGGSGIGAPQSSEVCKFPGCYSDTDPGIYDPNIYNPPITYTFPGPPVAAFADSGSNSGSGSGSGSSSNSTSSAPGTSSPSSPAVSTDAPSTYISSPTVSLLYPPPTSTSAPPSPSSANAMCKLVLRSSTGGLVAKRGIVMKPHKRPLFPRWRWRF